MTGANKPSPQFTLDRSRQRETTGALATARAGEDHVAIDFGELVRAADGAELSARLTRRIALKPAAAKRLHDMLARLTAETGVSVDSKG
jgi:hypothetical protein